MDNPDFTYSRERTANPARARYLSSSGMTPYIEDRTRSFYKTVVREMFGDAEELDGEAQGIAVQHTTDMLNSTLRQAQGEGGTLITTAQVEKAVARIRVRDSTIKPTQAMQITREAYCLVEEEYLASGGNMKDIASRYIMAGHAAMVQGFYGDAEDVPLH